VIRDMGRADRQTRPQARSLQCRAAPALRGVIAVICVSVVTGLSIWKPVQLGWLTHLFGGYPVARFTHLAAMICIALFLIVHLTLVAIFPRTLVAMVTDAAAEREETA
jgi:thiosulfate reductase cytochrome b subunit